MIQAKDISVSFRDFHVLNKVTVDFTDGELVCILGPNGAGKSTLLKAISGWLKVKGGSIYYNGESICGKKVNDLSKQRAFLSQKLNSDTNILVEELVMMGRYSYYKNRPSEEDKEIVQQCMQKFGIEHMAKRTVNMLSGGEQQRVHLARILAQIKNNENHPKFLLLDEPVNNLDIKYQHMILSQSQQLVAEGIGVVCVLHDLNLAYNYAGRLILMKKGEIVCDSKDLASIKESILEEIYEVPYEKINISK